MSTRPPRSSRQRYRRFVEEYLHHRLDDRVDADQNVKIPDAVAAPDDDAGEKPAGRSRR
ncbi:MAG: hypothetical protein LH467_01850 [Gemmatimonadaceae bacterium]|nr:hypothetical protein [Gemmatimonadaceae bacterium]